MKRILLVSAVVLIAAVGGGGWYVLANRDPLQQAKVLLSKGDYAGAILQLRSAIRDQPNSAEAHALLAQLRLAGGDPIAAEYEIKKAMELHWDPTQSLALLSQAYMREQKWKEILAEIPDHASSPEQTAYFLMTRAVAQRGLKDVTTANATLAQAEHLAPQNAEVHLVAAQFAAADGKAEAAMSQIDRSLALEPNRTEALKLKATLLASKGDLAGAIAELDHAVQTAPTRSDLRIERASLFIGDKQDAKAAADVEEVLRRDPKNFPAHYIKAVLLVREGKFPAADTELQQIDPVIAQFERGLYFKAMVKMNLGQNAQAEDAAISYINQHANDPDAVRLLAAIELATNHANRAIPYLLKAIAAGQRDSETLILLGRAYAADGKAALAEQALQPAGQSAQTPAELARLASARLQVGDLSGAAADFQRSVDAAPTQAGAAEALIATAIRLGQLDRAQEALDKLRQQAGETEAVGNLTGLLKLSQLDQEGALAAFQDTAKRFPDSIAARLNAAKVMLQLNRGNDAIPVLQSILDTSPAQPEALSLLAQTLLAQGRGEEAVLAAERARKAKPDDLGLVNGEAQLYVRLKQYDKALDLLNSAKVNGTTPTPLLATLGNVQLAAGQTEAAKQTFAALLLAEPNDLAVVLTNVEVLTRLKDFDGARRVLDDALQRQPGNLPLLQARVRVEIVDKGLDAGLKTAEQLRSNQANMPAAATLKGGLLMGARRFADSAAAFQAEYDREPSSTLAVALSEAKQAAGDIPGAKKVLQGWQGAHPDDPAVAQALGMMDVSAHDLDSAQRNLWIVLKVQPNNVIALNNLAWVLQQKGDKQAREYAQRAFEQSPTPEVTDTLGWIMTSEGDVARALPLLQAAAAGAPQNPAIQYHLAVALKNLNRKQEAVKVLQPLVDSTANFDDKPAAQSLYAELTKANP